VLRARPVLPGDEIGEPVMRESEVGEAATS
jgi:hypothetical protein